MVALPNGSNGTLIPAFVAKANRQGYLKSRTEIRLDLKDGSELTRLFEAVFAVEHMIAPLCESFPIAGFREVKPSIFTIVPRPGPSQISNVVQIGLLHNLKSIYFAVQIIVAILIVVAELADNDAEPHLFNRVQFLPHRSICRTCEWRTRHFCSDRAPAAPYHTF